MITKTIVDQCHSNRRGRALYEISSCKTKTDRMYAANSTHWDWVMIEIWVSQTYPLRRN
jgi:hypothetical protein